MKSYCNILDNNIQIYVYLDMFLWTMRNRTITNIILIYYFYIDYYKIF